MNTTTTQPSKIDWKQVIMPSVVALIFFTVVTGVLYPLLITGIAQVAFPAQANGSLIKDDSGTVIGSELIGQQFSNPAYFWGRPSATGPVAYNGAASSGSNYGPLNPVLIGPDGTVASRVDALQAANDAAGVTNADTIPVDLVTASASGLDPHISPAAAAYQVARVAALRGIDVAELQKLVDTYTSGRDLLVLGEPRVNVLLLNQALDKQYPLSGEPSANTEAAPLATSEPTAEATAQS